MLCPVSRRLSILKGQRLDILYGLDRRSLDYAVDGLCHISSCRRFQEFCILLQLGICQRLVCEERFEDSSLLKHALDASTHGCQKFFKLFSSLEVFASEFRFKRTCDSFDDRFPRLGRHFAPLGNFLYAPHELKTLWRRTLQL